MPSLTYKLPSRKVNKVVVTPSVLSSIFFCFSSQNRLARLIFVSRKWCTFYCFQLHFTVCFSISCNKICYVQRYWICFILKNCQVQWLNTFCPGFQRWGHLRVWQRLARQRRRSLNHASKLRGSNGALLACLLIQRRLQHHARSSSRRSLCWVFRKRKTWS